MVPCRKSLCCGSSMIDMTRYGYRVDNIGRIWTHNFQNFQFHENFTPQPCGLNGTGQNITHMGATIGAGVQDETLSTALASHDALGVTGTNYVCPQTF
jgi:hypothetical protein